jgi:hypothetical protein
MPELAVPTATVDAQVIHALQQVPPVVARSILCWVIRHVMALRTDANEEGLG